RWMKPAPTTASSACPARVMASPTRTPTPIGATAWTWPTRRKRTSVPGRTCASSLPSCSAANPPRPPSAEASAGRQPVVPDDPVGVQQVLLAHATADVVQHQRIAGPALPVAEDADMQQAAAEIPGHDVAGAIAVVAGGPALALEPGHEIGHPAVIDVAVRPAQAPALRVTSEVGAHVLVDRALQIQPLPAQGADHHVGADAGRDIDVAARI